MVTYLHMDPFNVSDARDINFGVDFLTGAAPGCLLSWEGGGAKCLAAGEPKNFAPALKKSLSGGGGGGGGSDTFYFSDFQKKKKIIMG